MVARTLRFSNVPCGTQKRTKGKAGRVVRAISVNRSDPLLSLHCATNVSTAIACRLSAVILGIAIALINDWSKRRAKSENKEGDACCEMEHSLRDLETNCCAYGSNEYRAVWLVFLPPPAMQTLLWGGLAILVLFVLWGTGILRFAFSYCMVRKCGRTTCSSFSQVHDERLRAGCSQCEATIELADSDSQNGGSAPHVRQVPESH